MNLFCSHLGHAYVSFAGELFVTFFPFFKTHCNYSSQLEIEIQFGTIYKLSNLLLILIKKNYQKFHLGL